MSNLDENLNEIKNTLNTNKSENIKIENIMKKLKKSIEVLLKFTNQKNDEIRQLENNEIKIDEFKDFFDIKNE